MSQKGKKQQNQKTGQKKIVTTVEISGMHCPSCEFLIQRKLEKIEGVKGVAVNRSTEKVSIKADHTISDEEINEQLFGTEYAINREEKISFTKRIKKVGFIGILMLPFLLLLSQFDMFTNGIAVQDNMSFIFILGLGVVASFSSCIAVAGGLLLGISTSYAKKHPNLSRKQKFMPHIYFNIGRVLSYTIFGVVIGYIGSLLTLSPSVTGIVTLIASGLMIIIGLQLLQVFPFLNKIQIGIPKKWTEKIMSSSESTHKATLGSAFLFGGLTFFLPCGFTQAMQLFVLGKGDPIYGGIAMFVFAIGTVPSFLSIGALASFLKKEWLHNISIGAGILVIVLGIFLLPSALTLVGVGGGVNGAKALSVGSKIADDSMYDGVEPQVVRMSVRGLDYYPSQFTVKKGVPVTWIIDGSQARGCAQILTIPGMNIYKRLSTKEENVIEFVPTDVGELPFHCSMAMTTPGAKFIVVE